MPRNPGRPLAVRFVPPTDLARADRARDRVVRILLDIVIRDGSGGDSAESLSPVVPPRRRGAGGPSPHGVMPNSRRKIP
jgi:hypothetical protein